MTTNYYQENRNTSSNSCLFLAVLILSAIAVLSYLAIETNVFSFSMASSHAVEKHGNIAHEIEDTCSAGKGIKYFYNPETGRKAVICKLNDGRFGISVYEKTGENVTAYVKNKMTTLDEVIRSLLNAHYVPH